MAAFLHHFRLSQNDDARQNVHDFSFPLGTVGEWSLTSCGLIYDKLALAVKTSHHPAKGVAH